MKHLFALAKRALGQEVRLEPRLPAPFEDEPASFLEEEAWVESVLERPVTVADGLAVAAQPLPLDDAASPARALDRSVVTPGSMSAAPDAAARSGPSAEPRAAPARPAPQPSASAISRRGLAPDASSLRRALAAVPVEVRERVVRGDVGRASVPAVSRGDASRRTGHPVAALALDRRAGRSAERGLRLRNIAVPSGTGREVARDEPQQQPVAPVVEVSIGRVEVRAAPPPRHPAAQPDPRRGPALDLESYLRDRARSS